MFTTDNGMNFLEKGDKFNVEYFKTMPAKKYPDRMVGKILTGDGLEVFTSSAKIIKVIDELRHDDDVTDLSKVTFEVYEAGRFNDRPVLSIKTDTAAIQKKINIILF